MGAGQSTREQHHHQYIGRGWKWLRAGKTGSRTAPRSAPRPRRAGAAMPSARIINSASRSGNEATLSVGAAASDAAFLENGEFHWRRMNVRRQLDQSVNHDAGTGSPPKRLQRPSAEHRHFGRFMWSRCRHVDGLQQLPVVTTGRLLLLGSRTSLRTRWSARIGADSPARQA